MGDPWSESDPSPQGERPRRLAYRVVAAGAWRVLGGRGGKSGERARSWAARRGAADDPEAKVNARPEDQEPLYVYIYIYVISLSLYIYIYIYIDICGSGQESDSSINGAGWRFELAQAGSQAGIYIYIYMYVYIYIYIYLSLSLYTYIYIYIYIYVYIPVDYCQTRCHYSRDGLGWDIGLSDLVCHGEANRHLTSDDNIHCNMIWLCHLGGMFCAPLDLDPVDGQR